MFATNFRNPKRRSKTAPHANNLLLLFPLIHDPVTAPVIHLVWRNQKELNMNDGTSKSTGGANEMNACCVTGKEKNEIEADHDISNAPTNATAAAAGESASLNLQAGEELTALTPDEMASVCRKLTEFARLNADRAGTPDGQEEQK